MCSVCGVLGHLALVPRCPRSVCCAVWAVSWATWLLFTDVCTRFVVLRVPCPGPLGSCSLVCSLSALCCVCGVLGHLASVHRCARSVCCLAFAVSWATSLLFTGVLARCIVLCVRCPGPIGSCSPLCPLGVFGLGVRCPGPLPRVNRGARSLRCLAGAVSWAHLLLFAGVLARCIALHVRCPGPLAPVQRCAGSVCCAVCALSSATWLLFTGVYAPCVVLRVLCPWQTWLLFTDVHARRVVLGVQCPGPLCSCSWV